MNTTKRVSSRPRIYAAAVLTLIARTLLRLVQRMHVVGIVNLAGVEYVIYFCRKLRGIAWTLLRSIARS